MELPWNMSTEGLQFIFKSGLIH